MGPPVCTMLLSVSCCSAVYVHRPKHTGSLVHNLERQRCLLRKNDQLRTYEFAAFSASHSFAHHSATLNIPLPTESAVFIDKFKSALPSGVAKADRVGAI